MHYKTLGHNFKHETRSDGREVCVEQVVDYDTRIGGIEQCIEIVGGRERQDCREDIRVASLKCCPFRISMYVIGTLMFKKDKKSSRRAWFVFVVKSMYATCLGKFTVSTISLFFTRRATFSLLGASKIRPPASPSAFYQRYQVIMKSYVYWPQ
jgi:hypothetical protein